MALPNSIRDREYQKFEECGGETTVRVKVCDAPPVNVTANIDPGLPTGYTAVSEFDTATVVGNGSLTTIVSYTVPVGKKLILDSAEVSGDNIATYQVDIGGTVNAKKRTYWGAFNESFKWDTYEIAAGTVVKIQVTQTGRPSTGNYDARIVGIEGPA